MSISFVQSNQVVQVNGNTFAFPNNINGVPQQIPCENTEIIASYWRIPQTEGNRVVGYVDIVAEETSVKPQPDALKVLRVKLTNTAGITTMDMAILDSDNISISSPPNYFAYLCDGTGGTLPVMPVVTVPYPIMQSLPQGGTAPNGDNTFVFSFPSNPLGLLYTLNAAYFNGQVPYFAFNPSGITTIAQFVTWANSHWSNYGVFTALSAVTFQLVSSTTDSLYVLEAGMNVDLTPVNFCFNLSAYSTPAPVNQFKFGTGELVNFNVPFLLTNNPVTLMNKLIPVMSTGTIFNPTGVANHLGINTIQAMPALYNNGSLVVASASGTC